MILIELTVSPEELLVGDIIISCVGSKAYADYGPRLITRIDGTRVTRCMVDDPLDTNTLCHIGEITNLRYTIQRESTSPERKLCSCGKMIPAAFTHVH